MKLNEAASLGALLDQAREVIGTTDEQMAQWFVYDHLPPHLADVSRPFGLIAAAMIETLPRNPERTACLRKLVEAKDCAVRSAITRPTPREVEGALVELQSRATLDRINRALDALERMGVLLADRPELLSNETPERRQDLAALGQADGADSPLPEWEEREIGPDVWRHRDRARGSDWQDGRAPKGGRE